MNVFILCMTVSMMFVDMCIHIHDVCVVRVYVFCFGTPVTVAFWKK